MSDFIYYHMYLEFGNICTFLTSILLIFAFHDLTLPVSSNVSRDS